MIAYDKCAVHRLHYQYERRRIKSAFVGVARLHFLGSRRGVARRANSVWSLLHQASGTLAQTPFGRFTSIALAIASTIQLRRGRTQDYAVEDAPSLLP